MLRELVSERVKSRNMSVRAAAREMGLSNMTLNRVLWGDKVDLETVEQIAKWLGISVAAALGIEETNPKLVDTVAALIATEPQLADLFQRAVGDLKKGDISEADLREIINYASFKILSSRRNVEQGGVSQ